MAAEECALGIDFGTESARALAVRLSDGAELGAASAEYPHGVMDRALPGGGRLGPDFALQHPGDYLEAMERAVKAALAGARLGGNSVKGIGVDFTACTPLPVGPDGVPLCLMPEFEAEPHAYVKLWKHHGALEEAAELNRVFAGADWLARYGGAINLEWILPKLLETWRRAPRVLQTAGRFIEASDWVVWRLVGREVRGSCAAGYKGTWLGSGYPPADLLARVDRALPGLVERLLGKSFIPAGRPAGGLTPEWARRLGLAAGTPVSAPAIDAHAAVPGCGVGEPGRMVVILGTSACHMLLSEKEVLVPGIQGVVRDGILPGFFGYEAGQAAVGDLFAWFAKYALPAEYAAQAEERGIPALALMEQKAAALPPGSTGLVALDWWNGNRSILIDPRLSGLVVGLTMNTRPEHLFRALLEAAACGTRVILDHFEAHGLPVAEVVATGGIAEKNPLFLQTLADVTGRAFHVARTGQACALGAAVFGAAAARRFPSVAEAARTMAGSVRASFHPGAEARPACERLYAFYRELHDHFGRGGTGLMRALR